MGIIVFLIIVGGIIYLIAKRGNAKVTDWNNHGHTSQTEDNHESVAGISVTVSHNDPKYHYEPSEDVTKFLRALIYVGKADGQLREDETLIMADFLAQQQPEHKQSDRHYLSSCIRDIKPFSTDQYNQFIRQLDNDNKSILLGWYKRIIATQKKNHPFEDHLLIELQNIISSA